MAARIPIINRERYDAVLFDLDGVVTKIAEPHVFSDLLKTKGVAVYESTVDLVKQLRKNGFWTAIVSSSKNCRKILKAAGIEDLFDTRVDGVLAESLGLNDKPEPDIFWEAARRLGVDVKKCVVVEAVLSGVEAGIKGGFGMVIGVNRGDQAEELEQKGAHWVVNDLCEVQPGVETQTGWEQIYIGFDPEDEGRREALCALGNGYFVTRGAAPEAKMDAVHYPGTYLAGGYNRLSTKIAGRTVENEDLVNMPNWLCLNFRIQGDAWFQLNEVTILFYKQQLHIKKGMLHRIIHFRDKKNRETILCQQSFVHGEQMHLAGLKMRVTPLNWDGKIEVSSALDGRVLNLGVERYQDLNHAHLDLVESRHVDEKTMILKMRTNGSFMDIAMGARTDLFIKKKQADGKSKRVKLLSPASFSMDEAGGYIAKHFKVDVSMGEALTIEKLVCIYTSRDSGIYECLSEAENTITDPGLSFDRLVKSHVIAWEFLWREFDVGLELDDRKIEQSVQKKIRLHIFHLLQSSSVHSLDIDVGMTARGWHGEGYRGHVFWDEMIIFPFLNYRAPRITRTLLMYRYRRLNQARRAAKAAGYKGAMYPWQSGSSGREETPQMHLNPVSGRWILDNTHLQRHVNTAIVYNIWQYFQITQDMQFLSFYGGEIIVEIARFWASMATYMPQLDRYEISGVMGPDEYHDAYPDSNKPGLKNNGYTNLMVTFVMEQALNLQHLLPRQEWKYLHKKLAIDERELATWQKMSRRMRLVFHDDGIISQFEGYEKLKEFNWAGYQKKYGDIRRLDRILEREGDSANNYKLSKQPDVLMLFYLFSAETLKKMFIRMDYPFGKELISKNINYYLSRTTNGSSLALVIHSWIEARRKRDHSWELFSQALETDMVENRSGSTREGIHLAAMSGCIDILQRGYAGLEIRSDLLILNPLLPRSIKRIRFHIRYRKHWLDLEITQREVRVKSLTNRATPFTMMIKDEIIKLYPGNLAVVEI
jgi:alpha,alpha-trehalase